MTLSPLLPFMTPPASLRRDTLTHPRVLSIAGSDPSGGAGIQADIKSISAHGGYAMSVITALTAQNTQGVCGVHVPPVEFLRQQLEALSDDIVIDSVKIGMLANTEVIRAVGDWLKKTKPAVVVLDPVMVASSGDALRSGDTTEALIELLEHANLVTPNLAELAILVGEREADSWETALKQGKKLAAMSNIQVLVKGGHLAGEQCPDALIAPNGALEEFVVARVDTANTHGTGCSLSAALATVQLKTQDWGISVARVKAWLTQALATSAELAVGQGSGPINHFYALWDTATPTGDDFSQSLWADITSQRMAIFELDFIRDLAAGTLSKQHFAYYLAQDAKYLGLYSRVLARASSLAPTETEQRFWAQGAQNCLEVELELHRNWLHGYPQEAVMGPVTKHYVDHLQAVAFAGSYGEVVAAVLPCYWLYAEVGEVLACQYRAVGEDHPYGAWLQTYGDDAFAQATKTAIAIADSAAQQGSAQERARMRAAFIHSAQFEVDFFDAPRLHA